MPGCYGSRGRNEDSGKDFLGIRHSFKNPPNLLVVEIRERWNEVHNLKSVCNVHNLKSVCNVHSVYSVCSVHSVNSVHSVYSVYNVYNVNTCSRCKKNWKMVTKRTKT